MSFRKDFYWGAATASYQIEGAYQEDGKGLSVWDSSSHMPGFVKRNENGDVACDHYHRYQEDVKLMKEMGLNAYRFSVSWPRVLPNGTGKVNEKGLDFYDRLVDELLKNEITPFMTLFHWDYPLELYKRGDILNRDSSKWFAEYTQVLVDRLSDRVSHFMTLNEPQCYALLGHELGKHAPGVKLPRPLVMEGIHNLLLAHGRAVQVIRDRAKAPSKVGMAPVFRYLVPKTDSKEDIELTRKLQFKFDPNRGGWDPALWMDPIFEGDYPKEAYEYYKEDMPIVLPGEMDIIHQPLDYFGFNFYRSESQVHQDAQGNTVVNSELPTGFMHNALNWEITPRGMYYTPKFLYEKYKLPILITENGMTNLDFVSMDGKVHDPQRIDYMKRHLTELRRAAKDGVDVMGYLHWSLMDNFEWAEGYNERFGLIHVDYQTQKRTMKDSAYWYKEVIASNGEKLSN